jgi:5-methylcytosine-specific restriction endonuclease McrA
MNKTAFPCTQCGDPLVAKNALGLKLITQGKLIVCDNCRAERSNGRVWSKDTYAEYLKSPQWQERRKRALRLADGRCQVCSNPARDVHHNTYERLGRELDRDLIAVCGRCHDMITKHLKGRNGS